MHTDAGGDLTAYAGTQERLAELTQEVARLQSALEAAARHERELAASFESAALPMHCVGPDGTILRANQAELDLLGYTLEEYVGRQIAEFHMEQPVIEDILRRLGAGEVLHNCPARLRCKDGSVKDVLIDSSVYWEDGRFIHTRCFTRDVTAQRLAEEELRRSQERFHLAARAAQHLIWDWDLERNRVTWDGNTRSFFGCPPEAMVQLSGDYRVWASKVHPDDLAGAEAVSRAAIEGGAQSWEHEYRFRREDGRWGHMLERAFIQRDRHGRATRAVATMEDITSRLEADEATSRLAAIVSSSADAIVGKTLDGIVTSWNAAAERIFGYTVDEMVGQSVFALIPAEFHAAERDLLERIGRGERVEIADAERIRKDGARIYVALSVSPIRDAVGSVVGASSITRDVTERRRIAEELARREERYRALVTATSSVVWTTDPEGKFVEPQPSWEAYTGQPWEVHRGFGWAEALHPEDRESVKQTWFEAARAVKLYESRGRLWNASRARYRHFVARAAPVVNPDGAVREWIGTVTDVEEEWQAAQRLRDIERMESVGRLAGGVAHEVNNQMTVVLGFTDFLLRRADLAPTAHADLRYIRQAAEHSAAVTQQLLAFGRRQILHSEILDLNALITDLAPILGRTMGENVLVELRLRPGVPPVLADALQLQQAILNLALNARDAMPGGGELWIETAEVTATPAARADAHVELRDGTYTVLTLRDTGHGMDAATLAHLFEPFFTTKPSGEGTGLGLSSVYGTVKQLQGQITVESEPGQGTTFRLYLPSAERSAAPRARFERDSLSVTVLVAEDDPTVREMICRTLRQDGYRVLEATDGRDALAVLHREPNAVNLLIADVAMPRMGGRELSEHFARVHAGSPTLFISAYPGPEMIQRGLLTAGLPFLEKPFTPNALAMRVQELLKAAGAQSHKESIGIDRRSADSG